MILLTVFWTCYFTTSGNWITWIKMWKIFDMASNQCCCLMTFCLGLDIISIYFWEIIKFIKKCWRSCNAWEQEYTLSIFWKFLKRVPAEKILFEFKVCKSESQAIQIQVIHTLQNFSPILLRKKILQPKKATHLATTTSTCRKPE